MTESDNAAMRLKTAKAWARANAVRHRFFDDGETLFTDPAWAILLDLFIEAAEGRPVTVSNACLASRVPSTTGLRWLKRLYLEGLVDRAGDEADARRTIVSLSDDGLARMVAALDAAIEGNRRMGIGRIDLGE
jgi:hypothetical protein